MKKSLKIFILSAGFIALSACSTTKPSGADVSDATDVNGGANSGVVATGAGDADNFGGASGAGGDAKKMQVGNQSYYFDFNKYDVHAEDLPSVKVQADYLATHANGKVLLAGNTDERGSREYNIALGNKRAQSIAQQLTADGVSANQVTTVSYGAEKPAALGHDESAWAKNRRVDLTYQTPITLADKTN